MAFMLVGATNTVLSFAVFTGMTVLVFAHVRFGYMFSLVASYVVGILVAFVLYRRFVFTVRGHVLRDFARFVTVYAASIAINLLALPALIEFAHVPELAAQAMIVVVIALVSYVGHKGFSFRRSASDEARTREASTSAASTSPARPRRSL